MDKDNLKRWAYYAGMRTLKTAAETAIALIGTNTVGITDVDWPGVFSAVALASIMCVLSCIVGMPEVDLEDEI